MIGNSNNVKVRNKENVISRLSSIMVNDLDRARDAAKAQKTSYLNQRYEYQSSKLLEAECALQKTNNLLELRSMHAGKIVKGKEVSKAMGKNIDFWEIMAIKFQAIHSMSPEELLKTSE